MLFIICVPVVFWIVGILIWALPVKKEASSAASLPDIFYAETRDTSRSVSELYEILKDMNCNGTYLQNKKSKD